MSPTYVLFVNHTADHSPGEIVLVPGHEARRLTEAFAARYLTDEDVTWLEAVRAAQPAEGDEPIDEDPPKDDPSASDKSKGESTKAKAETAKQA